MTVEEWRPILGREGAYEVSSHGRVRSLDRTVERSDGRASRVRGRVISQMPDMSGRLQVTFSENRKREVRAVHTLVVTAFSRERKPGEHCRHLNGVRTDNLASNLQWGTPSENVHDQVRHGVHVQARKTHCPRGHEYTAANTLRKKDGNRRICRECNRKQCREYKARRTARTHREVPDG